MAFYYYPASTNMNMCTFSHKSPHWLVSCPTVSFLGKDLFLGHTFQQVIPIASSFNFDQQSTGIFYSSFPLITVWFSVLPIHYCQNFYLSRKRENLFHDPLCCFFMLHKYTTVIHYDLFCHFVHGMWFGKKYNPANTMAPC